jgi:hypothetical protein
LETGFCLRNRAILSLSEPETDTIEVVFVINNGAELIRFRATPWKCNDTENSFKAVVEMSVTTFLMLGCMSGTI